MARRLTTEDFIEKSRKVHGSRYEYNLASIGDDGNRSKVTIICPDHGEFTQRASNHISGRGCRKCGSSSGGEAKRSNTEKFIEKAISVHGRRYDYSKVEYRLSRDKVKIICHEHGEFLQEANSHLMGVGCPKCWARDNSERRRMDSSSFIEKAKSVHGDRYDYSLTEYTSSREKVLIRCNEHGAFSQTPDSHLQGSGCPKCGMVRSTMGSEGFAKRAKLVHGDAYDYSMVDYIQPHLDVRIICPDHGEFLQTPSNHLSGKGCGACGFEKCRTVGPSRKEQELAGVIESFGITIEQSRRGLLGDGREIDIYLPDFKIGIEFNGLYWHSDAFKGQEYHQKKSIDAMDRGIKLIHVWEDDWMNPTKRQVIIQKIKHMCGLSETVYARKTEFDSNPSSKDVREFLERTHIQGYLPSNYVALRHEGDIVAVLGMKRAGDSGEFELTRFSTSCSVVGGFSKLLKNWKKANDWSSISTYAHLDYSHGDLYRKNGFECLGTTKPNYWYIHPASLVRESRQSFMKHKLADRLENFDPSLTERENMSNNGYLRVYDAGSIRFKQLNTTSKGE